MHDFGQHNFLNENMAQLSNKCDIKTMDIRQLLQTLLNATQKKALFATKMKKIF